MTVLFVIQPFTFVVSAVLIGVRSKTVALIFLPVADILGAVIIKHRTFAFLEIAIPHALITIVVQRVERAATMLLILKPLTVITFTVGKGIYTGTVTFSFHIIALIHISVLELRAPYPVRLSVKQIAGVDRTILKGIGAHLYLLGVKSGTGKQPESDHYIYMSIHIDKKDCSIR